MPPTLLSPPATSEEIADYTPMTQVTLPPLKNSGLAPLIGKTQAELVDLFIEMGHPRFRAEQVHHWLYVKCVQSFDEMLNLSKGFRQHLAERFQIGTLQIASKQISEDGTVKYLFQCADGNVIESVLMYFEERGSYALCVSTQVGCAINCSFCATGKMGLKRHLSASEIVEQYVQVQADSGKEIRNVVYMGQGEPLHNYENTVKSLRILNESCEVGMRRITVSTSGLVDHIDKLAEEEMPLTLALSLHAPNNEIRSRIMPINKRWPLETLIPSLERYLASTNRRLTMEYIMIDGINDQPEHAHQLGQLIQHLKCNINLIPYNPIAKDLPRAVDYKRSSNQAIRTFMMILLDRYHKKVTVRLERGVDIDAACGQLANRFQADKEVLPV
ncbi:MAG: 23S rRNA (adenine(2503)-C(2))-methyltransferase RlmN [Vampirovibrionales bacterium]|jgi:23S rRNA (adenine2503-C2)-methyltransferase|nr:23S rRNA (adenine(2503)-C(2))-methyltransferase RlmN [Vampirovibrionales bacterium]